MKITLNNLEEIKCYAKDAFKHIPNLSKVDSSHLQVYCIIKGLEYFLSKGQQYPGFTLEEAYVQEDSEPVED